eukprot:637864-Rhodomonas_salina.1
MLLLHLPAENSDIDMVIKIMAEIQRLQNILPGEDPRKRYEEINKLSKEDALHLGKDLESRVARTLVMIMALLSIYMHQGAVYRPNLDLLVQRNKKDLKFNAQYGKEISKVIKEITYGLVAVLNEIMDLHREDVLATIRSKLQEASGYILSVFEKIPDLREYKPRAREIVHAPSNRKRKYEDDEDQDEEEPDEEERRQPPTWKNANTCMANVLTGRGKHPQARYIELIENISQEPVEVVSGKRRRTV